MVNDWKRLILDSWQGSEYASGEYKVNLIFVKIYYMFEIRPYLFKTRVNRLNGQCLLSSSIDKKEMKTWKYNVEVHNGKYNE